MNTKNLFTITLFVAIIGSILTSPSNNLRRLELGAAGVIGLVLSILIGIIGIGMMIACYRAHKKAKLIGVPIISDSVDRMTVTAPVTPAPVVPVTPPPARNIVIDNAHPVIPTPIIKPMPDIDLPPPRKVMPVPIVQPAPVQVVTPAPVQVIQQPVTTVTEVVKPVVEPVITPVSPVINAGGVPDFEQPIFTPGGV